MLGLVGGAPGGETQRVADSSVIPIVVDYWAHIGMSLPPPPPLPHGRLLDDGSELLWGEEWRSVEEFRAACYEDFLLFLGRY